MNKRFAKVYNRIYKNKRYDLEASTLSKLIKGKSILDVGCGTGLHAQQLIKLGYNVEGVEPDEELYKQSSNIMKVYNTTIEDSDIQKTYDSAICMFQVLNYVYNVKSALRKIHSLLNKKGRLIVDMLSEESKLKESALVWDWLYTRQIKVEKSGHSIWVTHKLPFLGIEDSFKHTVASHDKIIGVFNSAGFAIDKIVFNGMDNLIIATAQ